MTAQQNLGGIAKAIGVALEARIVDVVNRLCTELGDQLNTRFAECAASSANAAPAPPRIGVPGLRPVDASGLPAGPIAGAWGQYASPQALTAAQRPQTWMGPESSPSPQAPSSGIRQNVFDAKTAQSTQDHLGEKQDLYELWVATNNYLEGRTQCLKALLD